MWNYLTTITHKQGSLMALCVNSLLSNTNYILCDHMTFLLWSSIHCTIMKILCLMWVDNMVQLNDIENAIVNLDFTNYVKIQNIKWCKIVFSILYINFVHYMHDHYYNIYLIFLLLTDMVEIKITVHCSVKEILYCIQYHIMDWECLYY